MVVAVVVPQVTQQQVAVLVAADLEEVMLHH